MNPLSLINSSPYALLIKAGLILLVVASVFGAGSYAGWRWEHSEVLKLQLADAQFAKAAVAKAAFVQAAEDRVALDAAIQHATFEVHLEATFGTIYKEIPRYVHDTISCPGPTVGLARVLYAEAGGSDPAALTLASGQSDDDCSDVTASEVAGWFAAYAKASIGNARQLNDLEDEVRKDHLAQEGLKP